MNNKKDLLGGVIIITLLLLVLVTYIGFYNYNEDEETNKSELIMVDNSLAMINIFEDYTTLKVLEKSEFDNSKTIIGTYNCKNDDCEIYSNGVVESIYDDKYVFVKDNKKVIIYDFSSNKIVSNYYDEFVSKIGDYYIVKDNNKYGIVNKNGFEIVFPNYDFIFDNSIYDSYIKVSNNDKYGVIDLDNGNVVFDTVYKDINVTDSKYYSIFKDELWYVIDLDGNVITKGYEYVFAFNKGFIAYIDDSLYILKYNNENDEKLNNNVISVGDINNFVIERNGSIITIKVGNADTFQYNISRNNFVKK